ncbi:hypothetical protein [Tateyamaria sp. SN3-11]
MSKSDPATQTAQQDRAAPDDAKRTDTVADGHNARYYYKAKTAAA